MSEESEDKAGSMIRTYVGRNRTGINGFDLALDGGFLPGSTILLIGSATSGIDQFARQFWEILPEHRKFFMLDGYLLEGMIHARNLTTSEIFENAGNGGLIIDSLSTLIMREGIDPVLAGVVSCRASVQASRDNAFFTLYEGLHAPYNEIQLIRLCDVVIHLHEEKHGNEIIRTLNVKKMTGLMPPGRLLPFIISGKGIELSTTSRVV
ncbi:RAD55 family ATPase [Methanospirillum sp.]|jgi:KaiC/GvpD/RAD55 family RecA-like ATPase